MNLTQIPLLQGGARFRTTCFRYVLALIALGISSLALADRTIVILRHGEKPASGLGQLSCTGLNRSLALPSVLLQRYGQPIAIYAPNPAIKKVDKGIAYAYVRPLATIEPLAIATGQPVVLDYGMTDIKSLAQAILAKPEGTQIIAWEHHWGETLTRELLSRLGKDPKAVPKWEDGDFDGLFVIHVDSRKTGGEAITFTRETQNLDGLSVLCPTPNEKIKQPSKSD